MRRLTWKLHELLRSTITRRAGLRRHRLPVVSAVILETMEPRSLPTATASGVISGVAFIDANVDGNHDSGELAVRGVPVRLTGTTSQGTSINVTTTTTASGSYTFGNVLPGTYRLTSGPAQNMMGGAVTGSDFTVAGGQTVTRDLPLGGLRPEVISLRMFLTTTTPESFAAEAGFATAGTTQGLANERENNLPELASGTTTFELGKNEASTVVDLASVFTDPDMTNSQITFQTSVGDINLELFDTDAPQTVANFLNYVNDNRYDNTIIHRLISGFVAQGGGFRFDADSGALLAITKDPPVANEFGASNTLGTIAMAKLPGDPDSATNEFFFNLGDNSSNLDNQNGGFTVFGRLVGAADQEVLDTLAETDVQNQGGTFNTIPLVDYNGTNFPADADPDNFVTINDIQIVRRDEFLSYSLVSNSNNSLVTTSITNNRLALSHAPGTTGTAQVTIRATDRFGATFDSTFAVNIVNHAPLATVSVAPNAPVADATLTATATKSDADGDAVTLSYVWTVNGNVVQTTANSNALIDTLDLTTLADTPQPGDIVQVRVTPNDGEVDGTTRIATTRINQAPVIESVQLSSDSPTTNTLLTATVAASDADNDPIGLTYIWKVNNVIVQSTFNSTSLTNTLDLSLAGQGDVGDQITVEVTPTDGKVSGTTASASATVVNSAPTVDSLMLSPNAPAATQTITATVTASDDDGQPVTLTYVWKVNGEVVRTTADTTDLTDALDLSLLSDLTPGTPITVEVTPNDGLTNGAVATASTQINREPVIQSVGLTPDAPQTNATLTATVAASDADSDPVTLTYIWKVNDVVVRTTSSTASLTDTLDLSALENGDVADVVTVEVTPNDGKVSGMPTVASTTVADTVPNVDSLSLAPLTPAATQTVTATATVSDDDSQPVTLTYVWSINGTVMKTTANTSNLTDDFDLSLFPTLVQGDVIAVEVTPNDGNLDGSAATASTHINTRPLIGFVDLSDNSPTTNESVTATVTTSDADDDSITLTYVWKVNDVVVRTTSNTTSLTDTLDLSVAGNGDVGDQISLVVTPNDGKESGPAATSSAVVDNSRPTVDLLTLAPTTVLITTTSLTATATTSDDDGHAVTLTYVWKLNGEVVQTTENTASLTDTLDLSVLSQRQPGDAITVEVTPNDGLNNGTTATVSTAINRAPVVDAIQLSPIAPTTNALLTATVETHDAESDPITLTYVWKVNDVVVQTTANTSSLTDTLDLSVAGNGDVGNQISLEVTPSDGKESGATLSAAVVVTNTLPTVDSLILTPTTVLFTTTSLTATATTSDEDGHTVTLTYVWKLNGDVVQTTENTASLTDTLDLSVFSQRQPGDAITVEVTPNDGLNNGTTATVSTAINRAPVVDAIQFSPNGPTTNATLMATVTAHDADSDPITLTYVWKVNGVVARMTTNTSSLTDTFDLSLTGNGNIGDQISLEVTPSDGKESGSAASATTTVANALPTVDSLTVTPNAPVSTATLTATATTADDDGHAVTLTYVWKVNGDVVQTTENTASLTDTLDLSTLIGLQPGDAVTVEATPNDGLNNGTTATASRAINLAPVVDAIQFASNAPTTTAMLTATVTALDADSDPVTLTYVWKVNDVVVRTTSNTSSLTDTLDLLFVGNGNAGDTIHVEVTPSDGKVTGTTATSSVMVANSAPVVDSVVVTPSNPIVTDTLTATVAVSDDDGDAVTVSYVWKVNGGIVQTTLGAGLTDTLAFGLLPDRSPGDVVTVEVTPNDGTSDGTIAEASVTIMET